MSVWAYVHLSAGAYKIQKRMSGSLEPQAVGSFLTRVLDTKVRPSARAISTHLPSIQPLLEQFHSDCTLSIELISVCFIFSPQ